MTSCMLGRNIEVYKFTGLLPNHPLLQESALEMFAAASYICNAYFGIYGMTIMCPR